MLRPVLTVLILLAGCRGHPDTPLASAAANGDIPAMERLIAAGADVNGGNGAALVWAARSGAADSIPVLVKHGANPNLTNGVNSWTPLMHAIHKHQVAAVGALLKAGANVEARAGDGTTALMMAAGYGYDDIVRVLLDGGADPRARGPQGMSALDLAVSGVPDIDRFTAGDCQGATIQALIERAPDMKLSGNARVLRELEALKLKGCAGVAQIEGRRFVSR
jgi:ankyrin repeat protein